MYRKYFGMKGSPFSIAPDPRYLYMSEQHREALAHLLYGIRSDGGFVLLTGEVGTGKTTICRRVLETLTKNVVVAFIINPTLSVPELLATVCDEFGISYPGETSVKVLVDLINGFLLDLNAKHGKAILIIDEAQNLSRDVLEQIRLLTNLETNERKLLQIILIGQPELKDKLAKPELRQLAQRIAARFHLKALSKAEVVNYVNHRLTIARGRRKPELDGSSTGQAAASKAAGGGPTSGETSIFSRGALNSLYFYSGGVPRLVNLICDRALLGAFVLQKKTVDRATLAQAACEVLGGNLPAIGRRWKVAFAAAILVCACLGLLYHFSDGFHSHRPPFAVDSGSPDIVKPLPTILRVPEPNTSGTEPNNSDNIHLSPEAGSPSGQAERETGSEMNQNVHDTVDSTVQGKAADVQQSNE
jgi:general secretion pathway protein A